MASTLDSIKSLQHTIEKYANDEQRVLKCIDKLYHLSVTVQHLQDTGVGRTVNALRKEPGDVGTAARALVNKWKLMVASEETSEPEDHCHDTTKYNGNGHGKDSDDNTHQSRRGAREPPTDRRPTNGDHSTSKRKYSSTEDSEPDTKKSRVYRDTHHKDEMIPERKIKQEPSSSDSDQSDSQSDSDSSESSEEDVKEPIQIKKEIKTEPDEDRPRQIHVKEEPKETTSKRHHNESESTHRSRDSKSCDDKSKSRSSSHKSSKERDISTSKKSESSSHRHSATEKHTEKSHKHKESSSKTEKHRSGGHHKSDKDKHKNSSDIETEKDRHKSTSDKHKHRKDSSSKEKHSSSDSAKVKHSTSSSSKEKHNSSDSSKEKQSSSHSIKEKHSSSEKSSKEKHSHREKNHSSDSKSKSKSDTNSESERDSRHKSSSSSKHKSKSSKEDAPKKKKEKAADSDDGIDCGSGASFAEALGMVSPAKKDAKKRSQGGRDAPGGFSSADLSPASLLAPSASLPPLPPLHISALPDISPHYRPRPAPRLAPGPAPAPAAPAPHALLAASESDAAFQSRIAVSKNQRTKVYSGNKVYGKLPSLYELCVRVLQEHIDALEYTGGVPYDLLKPVVDRATPQQLLALEHHNAYLLDDTQPLWRAHCTRDFRREERQQLETWREMYVRCQEEQECRLKSLTSSIRRAQEAKQAPVKQVKMAYVDSAVKPPRGVARKQALHGTARPTSASPAARVSSLSAGALRAGSTRPPPAPAPAPLCARPKKAPLMQKALQLMRGRKR